MENLSIQEKHFRGGNGYVYLLVNLLLMALGAYVFISGLLTDILPQPVIVTLGILLGIIVVLMWFGFVVVNPNESLVFTLFGKYSGTIIDDGFHFVNPFFAKKRISLRARNLVTEKIKVNDKLGNPIEIGAVVVWMVKDTARAAFDVDDYIEYVNVQSESALRILAGAYSYDNFEHEEEISLRNGSEAVNEQLEHELTERLSRAGVVVIEARITHLAYASEIAGAMLQRQQATAIVAARHKIVEGAVSMVEMALNDLKQNGIVDLDEEKKAAMVSNLMVVLCSDRSAQPVINTGTLHQ
jgi:hypothetical protein